METFCPPEDANLHPDGPLQKIVIPAEIRSNTERMEYFTSICAALKTPALQACKVAFTKQALIFPDAEREAILDAVIRRNPVPIPITVVSSRPSYAGIRVINKEAYHPPAGIPAPPDGFPNHRLIETLTQGYDPASPVPTQQEIISAIEKRSAKFSYCVNVPFDHLSPAFEGFLEKDPVIQSSPVDPSMNRLVGVMPGINTSFLYIASPLAHGEMHVEDSHLESYNVVIAPLLRQPQNIPLKWWLFVLDSEMLIRVVRRVYRPAGSRSQICQYIYLHKNLFFSPAFLDEHNIPYSTLFQYAGDCVYVRYGVFHQVINISGNLAEAKNFADAIWNLIIPHLTSCHCENLPYVLISPNPDADITYSSRQLPAYSCQERNCEFFSRDQTAYLEHTRLEHGVSHPIVAANERFCLACWRKFRVSNAADHISRPIHKKKVKNLPVGWDDTLGFGKYQYRFCNKIQLDIESAYHHKTCKSKPYHCAHCPYTFTTKCGLELHIFNEHAKVMESRS
ncbi:hypothetical protein QAD02_023736 [Eretmocerus hayati]|uniref:Uncharacterized protein n=1 Tax=Eretmocerus hayati TaxID=131215 RepID=A0ACC2PYW0_9HYME|nr:hypothetical protein QAD02_023736 [Eretmocerus hayati]